MKVGRKFRVNDVQRAEARQRLANGEAANALVVSADAFFLSWPSWQIVA